MSEQAFREKRCSCVEHQSVDRLRDLVKEKDAELMSLRGTLADILALFESMPDVTKADVVSHHAIYGK